MTLPMDFTPDVRDALSSGSPVVALETTIVTHGMPFPDNLTTAQLVEDDIRSAGATPATIAVMDGRLKIGLDATDLEKLAHAKDVAKLSRADFAYTMAAGGTGSTTVAATMIAAHLAGIKVFATGGIGGVHRGADKDFDISADLQELAQTPVTVVSAGPKAILDVPGTMEVLESYGVPVFAFGQDEIPAFWSRSSGLLAPLSTDDPALIAKSARVRDELGLAGGQLVTNPIPKDAEIPARELEPIIDEAIKTASNQGIVGKAVTPFLLGKILDLTQGRSLVANIALIRNNARLAARIAVEFGNKG